MLASSEDGEKEEEERFCRWIFLCRTSFSSLAPSLDRSRHFPMGKHEIQGSWTWNCSVVRELGYMGSNNLCVRKKPVNPTEKSIFPFKPASLSVSFLHPAAPSLLMEMWQVVRAGYAFPKGAHGLPEPGSIWINGTGDKIYFNLAPTITLI